MVRKPDRPATGPRRQRRTVTQNHQHEPGSAVGQPASDARLVDRQRSRRNLLVPDVLSVAMRRAWLKIDPWAPPDQMDSIWRAMMRFAVDPEGREGDGEHH